VRAALALAACLAAPAAVSQPLDDGWWVVVASSPAPGLEWTARDDALLADVARRLRPCGLEAFNDWSDKFEGLRPGYHVAVLGAYATRGEGEAILRAVLACAPDANLRRLRYYGE
jgi:hypothetical protein